MNRGYLFFFLCILLCPGSSLSAHKITAFAFIEEGNATIEVRFSNNVPVRNPLVQCKDTSTGETVITTTGGTNGTAIINAMNLSKLLSEDADCQIVCETADGHRATWTIYKKELPSVIHSTTPSASLSTIPSASMNNSSPLSGKNLDATKIAHRTSPLNSSAETVLPQRPRQPGLFEAVTGVLLIMGCGALIQYRINREKK